MECSGNPLLPMQAGPGSLPAVATSGHLALAGGGDPVREEAGKVPTETTRGLDGKWAQAVAKPGTVSTVSVDLTALSARSSRQVNRSSASKVGSPSPLVG